MWTPKGPMEPATTCRGRNGTLTVSGIRRSADGYLGRDLDRALACDLELEWPHPDAKIDIGMRDKREMRPICHHPFFLVAFCFGSGPTSGNTRVARSLNMASTVLFNCSKPCRAVVISVQLSPVNVDLDHRPKLKGHGYSCHWRSRSAPARFILSWLVVLFTCSFLVLLRFSFAGLSAVLSCVVFHVMSVGAVGARPVFGSSGTVRSVQAGIESPERVASPSIEVRMTSRTFFSRSLMPRYIAPICSPRICPRGCCDTPDHVRGALPRTD